MKVYMLIRTNSDTGISYVYARNESEAFSVMRSFDETGEWRVLRVLEDFAQIINYEP